MIKTANRVAIVAVCGLAIAATVRWAWSPWARAKTGRHPDAVAVLARMASEFGGEPSSGDPSRSLRWNSRRDSPTCIEVYELRVDETFANESVSVFLGRPEEHSRSYLAIGSHPRADGKRAAVLVSDTGAPNVRELFDDPRGRELGPAAPDLACRQRTWDPLEDALALGWPKLPAGAVRPGDTWRGQRVGGRCLETPCLDPNGTFDPSRSCQTQPWGERLAGWVETGAGPMAVLRSSWDDGHEDEWPADEPSAPRPESTSGSGSRPEFGILTSREVAIVAGRPALATAEIRHRWTGVIRNLELRAIDDCTPGLRGPDSPAAAATLDRVRASLR